MGKNKQKFLGFWLGFLTAMGACNPALAALSESDKASQIFRNLLSNPGAENGLVGMTASGGSLTRTTTAANVGTGNAAFSWDSSSAGQTLTATPQTIPAGWYGKNGVLSCNIQTPSGTATHTLGLWDGSTLTQATTITSSATYARTTINFVMPSSGSLGYRFTSVASNEPAINTDDCVIGLAEGYNLYQVSQDQFYGSTYFAGTASCVWSRTSTTLGALSTTAACPANTIEFNPFGVIQSTDADLPQVTLNNLPAGTFEVHAIFGAYTGTATNLSLSIYDGTNYSGTWHGDGTTSALNHKLIGEFSYSQAGNRTFALHCGSGTSTCNIHNPNSAVSGGSPSGLRFYIYKKNSSAETAYRPELLNWKVESTISGASPDLNTGSSIGSYTGIESGAWTLANATGALSAYIPCSSTNDSSGTTCSAGNESAGIAFTPPTSGDIEVCASYSVDYDVGAAGAVGSAFAKYRIVQTGNANQTVSASGSDEKTGGIQNISTNSRLINYIDHKVCGVFSVTGGAKQTFRLFYQDSVSGTVNGIVFLASNSGTNGVLKMTARPLTQNVPAPVFVGSVTSGASGAEKIERAYINTNCTISAQSSNWLTYSSGTGTSTGCSYTMSGFTSRPSCQCTVTSSTDRTCAIGSITQTATNFSITTDNREVDLFCMGPK